MSWTGTEIIRIAKEELNYDIPLSDNDDDLLVKYIFSEGNSAKLNKIVNHLIEADEEIANCIWRYFPLNAEGYKLEGKAKEFAEKRAKVLKEFFSNEGNLFNKTKDIPFGRGYLTPVTNKYREKLLEGIQKDIDDTPDENGKNELRLFYYSVERANRREGKKPSFAVIDNNSGVIGYISLEVCEYFSMRSSPNTYNLEYYVLPDARRKGYMKEALPPLVQAIADGKILIMQSNPLIEYDTKVEVANIKMLNALIYEDNEASIRSIKSLNLFEDNGTIKLVSEYDGGIDKIRIFSKIFV